MHLEVQPKNWVTKDTEKSIVTFMDEKRLMIVLDVDERLGCIATKSLNVEKECEDVSKSFQLKVQVKKTKVNVLSLKT